ncbi:hypothetical protein O181_003844 [Austropuccinia psidii MF-1]|uniref:Uncharacterized protein n=1 Tax=Austropuccinia psidii MF-1 TaxID=1389203 RepID=A0A9Q3BER3_9BASI|nr:hypothetical protein [Austropuccinia psidii MF-1]
MRTYSKLVDRKNKLLPPIKENIASRKDTRASERLGTNVLQMTGPKDIRFVEKPKNLSQAQRKENSPVEVCQASTSKNLPPQVPNTGKQAPKNNHKCKYKWNKA